VTSASALASAIGSGSGLSGGGFDPSGVRDAQSAVHQRNYFENVARPTVTQTGDSDPGNIKVLNNYKVNSGTKQVRNGAGVAAIPYS
jgi:hypothetical protein